MKNNGETAGQPGIYTGEDLFKFLKAVGCKESLEPSGKTSRE